MSRIALIDGDTIAYICGFASQRNIHIFKANNKLLKGKPGKCKRDILLDFPEAEFVDVKVDLDDESLARHKLKLIMERILRRCETDEYKSFLTKSGDTTQFRNKIATIQPYKGNRKNSIKPLHHEYLRHLLATKYNSTVVNYYEADDLLAINHTELGKKSILCSIDKDLRQVPGLNYDIKRDEFVEIDQYHADLKLCTQWIMGDATDNIPGLAGYGEKRALQFLLEGVQYPKHDDWSETNKALIDSNGLNLQTWYTLIQSLYNGFGGEKHMFEIGNLVFMVRKRKQPLREWLTERGVN